MACHHVEKKTYDIYRHIKLRQSFVAVFVTSAGRVIDQHRDWVTSGGYSEHSLFIDTLVNHKAAMKAMPYRVDPSILSQRGKSRRYNWGHVDCGT